jgi:NAD(P)-dependent dehydrogenase (short-subunit alcohol dehydrogenase family)
MLKVQNVATVVSGKPIITAPFNVVITGGSKGEFMAGVMVLVLKGLDAATPAPRPWTTYIPHAGVGRAMAEEFLKAGDNVVVCARSGG